MAEAESKEKHGVCDPMSELTVTSPYVHSKTPKHIYHGQSFARVDFIPQSGTLDLAPGVELSEAPPPRVFV